MKLEVGKVYQDEDCDTYLVVSKHYNNIIIMFIESPHIVEYKCMSYSKQGLLCANPVEVTCFSK